MNPHTHDEARATPHEAADLSSTEGDVEAAASKYMDELTARVLASSSAIQDHRGDMAAQPNEDEAPLTDGDLDSKTAESLEKFMSTLKEHLQLEQDTWDMSNRPRLPRRYPCHPYLPMTPWCHWHFHLFLRASEYIH